MAALTYAETEYNSENLMISLTENFFSLNVQILLRTNVNNVADINEIALAKYTPVSGIKII